MSYITDYQYYENGQVVPLDANWGSYQYVSLTDIVNNFMLMYQGNNELINNIIGIRLCSLQACNTRA